MANERLEIGAAEAEVGDLAIGRGDDAVHTAGLVADLDTHARRDIQTAVAVDTNSVGTGGVGGIGRVQMIKSLLVGQCAVGLDLIAIDPVDCHNRRHTRATGRARG